jgi:hypothetical protein
MPATAAPVSATATAAPMPATATAAATPRAARAATEPAPMLRTMTYERPWQIVGPKRLFSPRLRSSQGPSETQAKRPRGRPIGSTKASRNTKDIRTFASTQ